MSTNGAPRDNQEKFDTSKYYNDYQMLINEIESITKNRQGFGYAYADLEAVYKQIRPKLKERGFMIMQTVKPTNGEFRRSDSAVPVSKDKEGQITLSGRVEWSIPAYNLLTTLVHVSSGREIECELPLVMEDINPQDFGSALTYMRRYSLLVLLGIITDDDDGAQASKSRVQRQAPAKKPLPDDFEEAKKWLIECDKKSMYYGDVKNSQTLSAAEKQALINIIYPKG